MAFEEDIRATLAISQEEARLGSSRVINLPGGRTTTVIVPAGARDGQELRQVGQGLTNSVTGLPGDLILRISVVASSSAERAFPTHESESAPVGYASGPNRPAYAPSAPGADGVAGQPPFGTPQPYPGSGSYVSNPAYGQIAPPAPAYAYSGYPSSPTYGQFAPPAQTPPPPKPRRGVLTTTLIVAIVLILIVGSGLIYYLGYYQPHQAQFSATQTVQAQQTATIRVAASSTAQGAQATAQVLATSTAQAQATAQIYQNMYTRSTSGTPVVNDPLTTPTLNPLWDITIGSNSNGSCAFTQGSYHSTIPTANYFEPCYAVNTNYSDFAFQIDMTITQGDLGGVLLRANTAHTQFYLFRVGVDGSFNLYNYANDQASQAALLLTGTSKAMKGLNQSNEITVVAQKTTMYFYLNQQYLGSSNDNTYTSGEIGVFAESAKSPTDVAFRNAKIWTL